MTIALLSIYALIVLAGYVLSPIIDPDIEGADAFGVSLIWPLAVVALPFFLLSSARKKLISWSKEKEAKKIARDKEIADIIKELTDENKNVRFPPFEPYTRAFESYTRVSADAPKDGDILAARANILEPKSIDEAQQEYDNIKNGAIK